ncbi:hypothetical protein DFP72DRAFT_851753 [Ephemerocybe angulata]|uniref:Uncharacterized protein n=1 Tax=Ephemerocybe angulata TaxID=980116 RepID=A0A8H6HQ40_9AGAR|nr:hypothetical protein DFP72DRAFT_851753 [Tulosesus angulatus]
MKGSSQSVKAEQCMAVKAESNMASVLLLPKTPTNQHPVPTPSRPVRLSSQRGREQVQVLFGEPTGEGLAGTLDSQTSDTQVFGWDHSNVTLTDDPLVKAEDSEAEVEDREDTPMGQAYFDHENLLQLVATGQRTAEWANNHRLPGDDFVYGGPVDAGPAGAPAAGVAMEFFAQEEARVEPTVTTPPRAKVVRRPATEPHRQPPRRAQTEHEVQMLHMLRQAQGP